MQQWCILHTWYSYHVYCSTQQQHAQGYVPINKHLTSLKLSSLQFQWNCIFYDKTSVLNFKLRIILVCCVCIPIITDSKIFRCVWWIRRDKRLWHKNTSCCGITFWLHVIERLCCRIFLHISITKMQADYLGIGINI